MAVEVACFFANSDNLRSSERATLRESTEPTPAKPFWKAQGGQSRLGQQYWSRKTGIGGEKFSRTAVDRTYYDLLRMYANELDREHTVLFSYGFSFEDEHIRDITIRSLKNPTLKLVIFSFSATGARRVEKMFDGFNNVLVIEPKDQTNTSLRDVIRSLRSVLNSALREEET